MLVFIVLLLVLLLLVTTGDVVIVTVFTDDTDCPLLSIDELLSEPSCFIFLLRLYGVKRRTGPEAAEK